MEQNDISTDLIAYAQNLDLYAWRHRIIFALDFGEFDKALQFCEEALTECQGGLCQETPAEEQSRHMRNLLRLALFHARISAVTPPEVRRPRLVA